MLGSGPRKGIVYQKRGTLRVADIRTAEKINIWDCYRNGELERAVWIDDRSEIVIKVEGQSFIAKVRRKPYRNTKFKMRYSFVCDCGHWPKHLYYHNDKMGCRKCLGLYYRTYSHNDSPHLVQRDYDHLRGILSTYEQHYDEYEQRRRAGVKGAWQRKFACIRPFRMRRRMDRLRVQLKVIEARLWGNAAKPKSLKGRAEGTGPLTCSSD